MDAAQAPNTGAPFEEHLRQWREGNAAPDAEGLRSIQAAAQQGSADAEYLLAVLHCSDVGLPVDLKASLDHLQRAAERGHRLAQTELAALAGVNVAAWLEVPAGTMLSPDPRIAAVKGFLSPQLCDWMVRLGRPHLTRAEIYDRETGGLKSDNMRSNSAAPLMLGRTDTVLGFLRARIAALAEVRVLALEPSQILHYAVGEQFGAHHDFLDVRFPGLAKDVALNGQRGLTLLIYLNDDYEGGETAFPLLGRAYRGARGDALVFWNITEDGAADFRTQHVGTAPRRGEKWLFSQWIRVRPQ